MDIYNDLKTGWINTYVKKMVVSLRTKILDSKLIQTHFASVKCLINDHRIIEFL